MDSQALITGAVTIGVGALSGGITNAVAVWMLFHPHEPFRLGPFQLHGAIPKNKARLARSVGRTVGERLLTAEDISHRLGDPALRAAFDAAISQGVRDLLERDHGPLRESLDRDAQGALDRALPTLGIRVADRVAEYVATPAFGAAAGRLADELARQLGDRPIGAGLGSGDRAALRERIGQWARDLADGADLAHALRGFVGGELERLMGDDRPLIERLPYGVVSAVEQGISDSLPGVIERIGDALERPEARVEVLGVVREGIDRAIRDLVLHQRLLARLVVTDQAISRLLDSFAGEGADRLAAQLRTGGLQRQVRQSVSEALHTALRVPLGERLRRLGPERRTALAESLSESLLLALRSEAARAAFGRALDGFLGQADRRTWGDLLRAIPAETVARLAAESLASDGGRRWVAETTVQIATALLARPIGRPADWLGPEAVDRLCRTASDSAWRWVHEQVPTVVSHIQVQEMVEQKVLGFSTQRMEEIVRAVTQRELDLIVRLGYWLGGLVGLIAFGVNELLR